MGQVVPGVNVRAVFLCLLLSFIGSSAIAEDDVIVGDPASCHLMIEYEAKEQMLHLRPTIPDGADCEITPLMVQSGLYQALDRQRGNPDLKLIFLGRLVYYPWLSRQVINRAIKFDYIWDAAKGHARDGNDNAFVSFALFVTGLFDIGPQIEPFESVLGNNGYIVEDVSVEKVMAKTIEGHAGYFPFDALVHLRVKKVQ